MQILIYDKLTDAYKQREDVIKKCINEASGRIKSLKQQQTENIDVIKSMRKEQKKLRLMQNELNVEEVVKDRSLKVFT